MKTLLVSIALLAATPSLAAEWLCEAKDAVGYKVVGSRYEPTVFTADDGYVIRPYDQSIDLLPRAVERMFSEAPKYVGLEMGRPSAKWYFWHDLTEEGTFFVTSMFGNGDMNFMPKSGILLVDHMSSAFTQNYEEGTDYTPWSHARSALK